MKTQYRNMLWLAALPLAFAMGACQNEELAETRQSVNIEGKTVLRATMGSYNTPQGRAQVELGNEEEAQEVFMWNEEDAFMVYNQEEPSVSSLFTISGYDEWNNPSAEATFIGEGEISEGTKVTAIYPAPDASAVKDGVVTLAFADPYGTSMGDNSELRIEEYMKTHYDGRGYYQPYVPASVRNGSCKLYQCYRNRSKDYGSRSRHGDKLYEPFDDIQPERQHV